MKVRNSYKLSHRALRMFKCGYISKKQLDCLTAKCLFDGYYAAVKIVMN